MGPVGRVTLLVANVVKVRWVVKDPPGGVGVVKTPPAVSDVTIGGGRVGMTGAQTLFVKVWSEVTVFV